MNSSSLKAAVLLCLASAHAYALTGDDAFKAPDSLVLKNGSTVRGLIIKNTVDSVTLQKEFEETTYPKSEIVRIRDEADIGIAFTDIHRKGDLPSWRVIANDLRTRDRIKSLVEIPATTIDNGEFKNVPYMSFRANEDIELNIYGDPNDPAGIELGIYGAHAGNTRLRKVLRSYLAGFLTTRKEIEALYAIDLNGGIHEAGDITIEITPKSAPDAYGAWWISLYNRKDLDSVRMDTADYERLTRPHADVVGRNGKIIASGWTKKDLQLSERMNENSNVIARGFYRDANGDFRILGKSNASR